MLKPDAIKCIYNGKDVFLSWDLVSPSCTRLPFVSTTSTVTVELEVVVVQSLSCHPLCLW